MDCHEKEALKKSLANPAHIFTDLELQQIIDQAFFDDDIRCSSGIWMMDYLYLAIPKTVMLN